MTMPNRAATIRFTVSPSQDWARHLSGDPVRHLMFIPTDSASPDFFGGNRPGDNRWANSVVALAYLSGVWSEAIVSTEKNDDWVPGSR